MLRALFALALLALAHQAAAQVPLVGAERPAGGGYTGPGDIVSGATAWYGLRAYSAAIVNAGTQALVSLRRASDSHTCDIIVSASGGLGKTANCSTGGDNGTAVATWCNSTTCYVTMAYDQSGNGFNLAQATTGNQPQLAFSCIGSLPCLERPLAAATYLAGSYAGLAISAPQSFSAVVNVYNTANADFICASETTANGISNASSSNEFSVSGANSYVTSGAETSGVAHAIQGDVNGASTFINVDGTTTTGSTTSRSTSGDFAINGAGNVVDYIGECGMWPLAFTSTQAGNLCHNQYQYWGTSTSC